MDLIRYNQINIYLIVIFSRQQTARVPQLKRVCLILVLPMRTSEVHKRKAQPGLEKNVYEILLGRREEIYILGWKDYEHGSV